VINNFGEIFSTLFFSAPFFRVLGMLTLLPLGTGLLPSGGRLALAFGMAAVMTWGFGFKEVGATMFLSSSEITSGRSFLSIWQMASEAAFGAFLVLPTVLIIQGAAMCGAFFDLARGQSVGSLYDPLFESQESPTIILAQQGAWVHLVGIGALGEIFVAYVKSFMAIPTLFSAGTELSQLATQAIHLFSGILGGALSYFGVWIACFLLIDCAFVFIGKCVPQLSLTGELFQIKSALGFLLMVRLCDLLAGGDGFIPAFFTVFPV